MGANEDKDDKPANTVWVKWVVFGIVILTFMFLFKDEVKQLLGRTEEITVGDGKFTLKTRTTQTPIGETVVSNVPAPSPSASQGPAVPGAAPVKPPMLRTPDFVMDWPATGEWLRDDAAAAQIGALLVVRYHRSFGDFNPNINITMEQVGNMSLDSWMATGNNTLEKLGWQLVDTQMDEETGGGVRVMLNPNVPGGLYQIQRVLMLNGRAYVATASKLEADTEAFPQLYPQMREILNSFHLTH